MSEPTTSEREARDRRALAVAELLRSGWTAKEVGAGMRVIDAGGGVELAMQTMRAAREGRARMSEPTTSEVERLRKELEECKKHSRDAAKALQLAAKLIMTAFNSLDQ